MQEEKNELFPVHQQPIRTKQASVCVPTLQSCTMVGERLEIEGVRLSDNEYSHVRVLIERGGDPPEYRVERR